MYFPLWGLDNGNIYKGYVMSEIETEVFAVGKWNGYTFTAEDLHSIADSFKALFAVHKVPLKLGHNKEQAITDGQPALGWVDKVWVSGSKLMARFVDVPDVVTKAIKRKLYRKVSIELDMSVKHLEKKYDYVLSGVALLGADIPAVSTLKDLDAFMASRVLDSDRVLNFTAIEYEESEIEENDMSNEKELAELKAKLAQAESETAEFKSKATKLEQDAKEKEREAKETAIKFARNSVNEKLEGYVKDKKITPAQRDTFCRMLGVNDDDRVTSINTSDIDALLETVSPSQDFSKDLGANGSNEELDGDLGEILVDKIYAYQAEHGVSFDRAQQVVCAGNSKMLKQHILSNGEK